MKRHFVGALFGAALLAGAAAQAIAQMDSNLVADIPFEFRIEGKSYPAGKYTIRPAQVNGNVVALGAGDGRILHMFLTQSIQDLPNDKPARLIFTRYGDTHFLSRVYNGSSVRGWLVPPSAGEREAMSRLQPAERTTVAARR